MTPRSRKPVISHFNVMVVGFSGVGKTSFVRTLLESLKLKMPKEKRETMIQPAGNGQALITGPLERTLVPYTVSVEAEVDGEKMVLTLIDTPGFQTEYIVDKQLHDILGYIEHQFDLTLAEVIKKMDLALYMYITSIFKMEKKVWQKKRKIKKKLSV